MYLISAVIFLILCFPIYGQEYNVLAKNIADCNGAVELLHDGNYLIQFTGKPGNLDDLDAYNFKSQLLEKNSLFFKYTASNDGTLAINASVDEGNLQYIVFKNKSENIIKDLDEGKAIVTAKKVDSLGTRISTAYLVDKVNLGMISLKEKETILIFFNSLLKNKIYLHLGISFKNENEDKKHTTSESKIILRIVDLKTGKPVDSKVLLKRKYNTARFSGSEIKTFVENNSKIQLLVEAPGYIYTDESIPIETEKKHEIFINLQPLVKNEILEIVKFEFDQGTFNIISGTENSLFRFKDFLALHANVYIELDGHVNDEGDSRRKMRKLSRKRADKLKSYFVLCGIDESRISTKAFGNNFPIYPVPKTEKQAQANRRVEVKIL